MFNEFDEGKSETASKPEDRAREKADEFRMHAELFAVFEATRKFDAELIPGLDGDLAQQIRRSMGKLEKAKMPDMPVINPESSATAVEVLTMPATHGLSTNDYHIRRRPGEVVMVRWLAGDEVETFYTRLQAHFDAAIEGCREDERQAHEWKKDEQTQAYLDALDKVEVKMAERYLRDPIRAMNIYVLSTQSADELNIAYLADYIMSAPAADIVGEASAPPDEPTEKDLAWYFKLFSLRGIVEGVERMCFFAFLQKSDDDGW